MLSYYNTATIYLSQKNGNDDYTGYKSTRMSMANELSCPAILKKEHRKYKLPNIPKLLVNLFDVSK